MIDWETVSRQTLHPRKVRVLEVLATADRPLSPTDLAEQLDDDLGSVAYHVRALEARGLIVLAREEQKRGAVEHFYGLAAHLLDAVKS